MQRRTFLGNSLAGLAGALMPRWAWAGEDLADSRFNIIMILTDDQGYGDLGCLGHPFLQTPHLDRLYAQSTRLTDFQVSPTCSPTRSALMSGRLPFRNGVTHTYSERERMSLDAVTIAQALKTARYTTGIFGKWHLGDEDAYQPHNRGFDETFIHGAGGIGQKYHGSCADAPGNRYFDPVIRHNRRFVKTRGFCTDVFFRQALAWVKRVKDKPFFAYISTNAPHSPFHCPPEYEARYRNKCGKKQRGFYGMISNIDDNVGLLMRALDQWGLSDRTLLVFMTDNGTAAGSSGGMKGRKNSLHEGGTRVPAFFRLPGQLDAGVDVSRLTRHVDIYPTLAALAGAAVPKDYELDGRNLLPLLADPGMEWPDRYTFFHRGRWRGKPVRDRDYAVRNERWRLVHTGKRLELYDIRADREEQHDVISKHPDVAADMSTAYEGWWQRMQPFLVNEGARPEVKGPFHKHYHAQLAGEGIPAWEPPDLGISRDD